ncbi:MAG: ribulokinase [Fimbriimonadales bacterium]|nr:ribulokinase [Fimbriimonadales bacterium]
MAEHKRYALGLDYGTNSVRSLIVDVEDGREVATHVFPYPSGEEGILLDPKDPNLARQHPADYLLGFERAAKEAIRIARDVEPGFDPARIVGIGVDTTGSTPLPVDRDGVPLAFHDEFRDNPAAMAWLWKDHTSFAEAAEITEKAEKGGYPYLAKCGGTYSSEWFWSKVLHCLRTSPEVFEAAYSWVECADFIPAWVTGNAKPERVRRGVCAAGHKAMYHPAWGGLPSKEFLAGLDPKLAYLRDRLYEEAVPSDHSAGGLSAEWADKLGIPEGTPVAVGAFDAHMGAVGSGVRPGVLVKIMGTSSCDMTVAESAPDIPGLCGIVPGSILPGMLGLEAGQSAMGDVYNWFVSELCPAEYAEDPHRLLSEAAARMKPGESGLLALDWNNGNRTILVDPLLTGLLVGQTLHSSAPEIYRALIEATAFGSLRIIERFEEYGVRIESIVAGGGIPEKNAFAMQVFADVCNRPYRLSRSSQTCALGAAIFGAVVAGVYPNAQAAQERMTGLKETVYEPIAENASVYAELYELYKLLHDAFGVRGSTAELYPLMKRLIAIRDRVRKA